MFRHDCSYNIKFIFTNTKPPTFRTPKNQNIPNAPSRCLNFRFSVEGISNLTLNVPILDKVKKLN